MAVWLECNLPSPVPWDVYATIQRASDLLTYSKTANAFQDGYNPESVAAEYKIINTDLDAGAGGQGVGNEIQLWNGYLTTEIIPDVDIAIITYRNATNPAQVFRRQRIRIQGNAIVEGQTLSDEAMDQIAALTAARVTTDHGTGSYVAFGSASPKSNYLAPPDFTFRLTGRSAGDVTAENTITLTQGEQALVAFDFSHLARGHRIHTATATLYSGTEGGVVPSIDTSGNTDDGTNSHNHANVRIAAVTAGEYVVQCEVLTDTGMGLKGRGRITVEE